MLIRESASIEREKQIETMKGDKNKNKNKKEFLEDFRRLIDSSNWI